MGHKQIPVNISASELESGILLLLGPSRDSSPPPIILDLLGFNQN